MHATTLATACLLAACAPCALAAAEVRLRLLDTAQVSGTHFALGEVARVESADTRLAQRLRELPVGKSPRMGYALALSRQSIEDAIRRALPTPVNVQWDGARRIAVRTGGRTVDGARIESTAMQAVEPVLRARYETLELRPVAALESIEVPEGNVTLRARTEQIDTAGKRIAVPVEIAVDGRVYRTVPVWFAASGTPLRPPVQRNQAVAVRVREGAIVIESSGIALEDGTLNQVVQVRNAASGETFVARVAGERNVIVEGR